MMRARALLLGSIVFLTGCPVTMGSVLRSYGYTELRPPSTLMAPGTVVWVKKKRPAEVGIVCTQRASLGEDVTLELSHTAEREISRIANTSFNIDVQYLDQVNAHVGVNAVKNIKVTLRNPHVYYITDAEVVNKAQYRDPACTQAIAARQSADFKVSMVSSAFKADVTYTAEFNREFELSVDLKLAAMQGVAATLGLDVNTMQENTLSGTGLFWGVQDDGHLVQLGTREGGNERPSEDPLRTIPPEDELHVDETADVY